MPIGANRAGIVSQVRDAIPDSGLARLTFDNADTESGTAFDIWNNNDATINGATTGVTGANQTYTTGEAYDFEGSNDYLDFDASLLSSGPASVAIWANVDSWSDGVVLSGYASELLRTDGGANEWYAWDVNITGISGSLDQWDHFVLTDDGAGTVEVYKNATSQGTASYSSSDSQDWEIGRRATNQDRYFDGSLDDLRVYDKELTSTEVSNLYNNGSI